MLSEAQVTKQIRDVLNRCRIFHWKHWSGPMTYPKGISDILGIYQGRMLVIEVKRQGWEPPNPGTKAYKHFVEQQGFLSQVKKNGGIAFFAQSVEDVIERLELDVKLYPLFYDRGRKNVSRSK